MNKKAQGEVITTVLIILLVLAAIVIVWQVVNSTITKGSEQVQSQSGCIGINIETTPKVGGTAKEFVAKRSAQGGTFTASSLAVLVDGVRKIPITDYTLSSTTPLQSPLDTVTITFTATTTPTKSVEVAIIGDGTTCPGTGLYNIPA